MTKERGALGRGLASILGGSTTDLTKDSTAKNTTQSARASSHVPHEAHSSTRSLCETHALDFRGTYSLAGFCPLLK